MLLRTAVIGSLPLWIAIAGLLVLSPPVVAHEHVIVGNYELTVGWRLEPSIVGILNGLDLGIQDNSTGTPAWVVGVENNLTATLMTGPASTLKGLAPQEDRPGWYTFDVVPTVPGSYSVLLAGRLNATNVNVTVTLDPVEPASNYEFPVAQPTPTDLQNSITQLNGQIAQLNAQLATLQTQLTILIAVSVLAVLIGAGSLAFAIRTSRAARPGP